MGRPAAGRAGTRYDPQSGAVDGASNNRRTLHHLGGGVDGVGGADQVGGGMPKGRAKVAAMTSAG